MAFNVAALYLLIYSALISCLLLSRSCTILFRFSMIVPKLLALLVLLVSLAISAWMKLFSTRCRDLCTISISKFLWHYGNWILVWTLFIYYIRLSLYFAYYYSYFCFIFYFYAFYFYDFYSVLAGSLFFLFVIDYYFYYFLDSTRILNDFDGSKM